MQAVKNLNLDVQRGETHCIVGESGCGKSITALAMIGLLPEKARITAGSILFEQQNLACLNEAGLSNLRGNRMAMIFQEPMTCLNPTLTIGTQLTEGFLRHGKGNRKAAYERAIMLLEKVGISAADKRFHQYPYSLSGGLRQRVMIAMALMCEPDLIIADEPTTALDVTVQAQILATLSELKSEMGLSLIVITHDLGVVARIADNVTVMYAGEAVETGTVSQVFGNPGHPYTVGLQKSVVGSADRDSQRLSVIPGRVPSLVGGLTGCRFRNRCPHAIPKCAEADIDMSELEADHTYRCLRNVSAGRPEMTGGVL